MASKDLISTPLVVLSMVPGKQHGVMNLKPLNNDLGGYRKFRGYLFFLVSDAADTFGSSQCEDKNISNIITIITTCPSVVSVKPYKNVPR